MVWTTAVVVVVVLERWIGVVRHRLWIMMIAVGKSTYPCRLQISVDLISASRKRRDRSPSDDRRDPKRR